jgi:hypothetical protein
MMTKTITKDGKQRIYEMEDATDDVGNDEEDMDKIVKVLEYVKHIDKKDKCEDGSDFDMIDFANDVPKLQYLFNMLQSSGIIKAPTESNNTAADFNKKLPFSFSPNSNVSLNQNYIEFKKQYFKSLNDSMNQPPDFNEMRNLIKEINNIIQSAKLDNHADVAEYFEVIKKYLSTTTQFEENNPYRYVKPTTEKWNGFVKSNLP